MIFRPLPLLTGVTLIALAVLVSLGLWQTQRLAWKVGLIAQVTERIDSPPISYDEAAARARAGENMEYQPVVLRGVFRHDGEMHMYGVYQGVAGYYIYTPLERGDQPTVLVNRGFAPENFKAPDTRLDGRLSGIVSVTGLARGTQERRPFVPMDEPERNMWFTRNIEALSAAADIPPMPLMVDSFGTESDAQWPQGGVTRIAFRNNHLGYALTWFGLALTLAGVYVAYHHKLGRLTWTKPARSASHR